MHVLVLDAGQRAALAVTRSLGAAGHRVTTADESVQTLAGASRFSEGGLAYPSPYLSPAEFVRWISATVAERDFDAILPVTEVSTDLVTRNRDLWPDVDIPFAPIDVIDRLTDKVELYSRALELGVPVPSSIVVRNSDDIERAVATIGFPGILKPRRSRIRSPDGFISTTVRRAQDRSELEALLALEDFRHFPFLYQQCIEGKGQGVFALYRHGEAQAWFAHRRLREKPPEGGVSVLCESCTVDEKLRQPAKRLLDDARWHGVAMVEFKVTSDGEPYLMEVNARFWGSLQLAVDAGVDFPRLLVERNSTAPGPGKPPYRIGRRLRWFLGDLDRLYILLSRYRTYGLRRVLSEWLAFASPHPLTTRHETFRWTDPAPGIRELTDYVRASLRPAQVKADCERSEDRSNA